MIMLNIKIKTLKYQLFNEGRKCRVSSKEGGDRTPQICCPDLDVRRFRLPGGFR